MPPFDSSMCLVILWNNHRLWLQYLRSIDFQRYVKIHVGTTDQSVHHMEDTTGKREHELWLYRDTATSTVSLVGHTEEDLHIPLKFNTLRVSYP